jgi:hypothetical protein
MPIDYGFVVTGLGLWAWVPGMEARSGVFGVIGGWDLRVHIG